MADTEQDDPLIKAAREALRRDDVEAAATLLREATEAAETRTDRRLAARAKEALVGVWLARGQRAEALQAAEAALAACQECGDWVGERAALLATAELLAGSHRSEEAARLANRAVASARQRNDRQGEAGALHSLAALHLGLSEPEQALERAREALAIFAALADTEAQAEVLGTIVRAHVLAGDAAAATRATADAVERFRNAGDARGEAAALLLKADACAASGRLSEATTCAQAALELSKSAAGAAGAADKDQRVGDALLKLAALQAAAKCGQEALRHAEEALALFRVRGGKEGREGEAAALNAMATAYGATGDVDLAVAKVDEALLVYKELRDKRAQSGAMRTKINLYLSGNKKSEAREVAQQAVMLFRDIGDIKGEAFAQLLVSEVCMATMRNKEAVSAAKEALRLFKVIGHKGGQADALLAITTADYDNERGEGILAAQERATLFREIGDQYQEAGALLRLADAHVARIGKKLATCRIASAEDTIAALKAAKDAYSLFVAVRDIDGQSSAMRTIARVLLYNGVAPEVIESATDPHEVFQDVMSGKYSSASNALPPKPQNKQLKLEEVIPASKQLDKGRFAWTDPTAGYSYRLIWQPAKDREVRNRKPRGSYDVMALNTSSRTRAIPAIFAARCHDASERNEALVVHVISQDSGTAYATTLISTQNTIAAMVTARLSKLTFVQLGESHYDWTDTRVRQVNMSPVTLGLLRSARIEAPVVTIGFVAGDTSSWIADPAPLIENVFDTVESDESELMYKRGDAFAPLMIHAPMEDTVQYVLPWKKNKAHAR